MHWTIFVRILFFCEDKGNGLKFARHALKGIKVPIEPMGGKGNILSMLNNNATNALLLVTDLCGLSAIGFSLKDRMMDEIEHVRLVRTVSFEYELVRYLLRLNNLSIKDVTNLNRVEPTSTEDYYCKVLTEVLKKYYGFSGEYKKSDESVKNIFFENYFKGNGKLIDTSLSWLYPDVQKIFPRRE